MGNLTRDEFIKIPVTIYAPGYLQFCKSFLLCIVSPTFEKTNLYLMDLKQNISGFHHVAIKANDLELTVNFYQQLGFEIVHEWSLPEFNLERCLMLHHKGINYYLEICDKNADMPTQGRKRMLQDPYIENALLHICFTVKDADAAREQALQYGAKDLSNGSAELPLKNGHKTVYVKNSLVYSPNGEVIEFLEQVAFD